LFIGSEGSVLLLFFAEKKKWRVAPLVAPEAAAAAAAADAAVPGFGLPPLGIAVQSTSNQFFKKNPVQLEKTRRKLGFQQRNT